MADSSEFRCEKMIPEMEVLIEKLFERDEAQAIQRMRRDFENKIHKFSRRKDDFIKYINFETQLLKMIKLRNKKYGNQHNAKMVKVETFIGSRLHRLFVNVIRSFPRDLRLWISYIKFCKQMNYSPTATRVLEQMLDQHGPTNPELFKVAADIAENEYKDTEKARRYLLMGIHLHKDSKLLLAETFKLELNDAERKRKESKEKNSPIDPSDTHQNVKKAVDIYDNAIKKFNDVELMNDLLNICAKYDFASSVQAKINEDMFRYATNERMWDIVAKNELNLTEGKVPSKEKIEECVRLYKNGTQNANTDKMWEYYLDTLIELNNIETPGLAKWRRKVLLRALQDGDDAGKLTEKHYLKWASVCEEMGKHKRVVEALEGAVKKFPTSVNLWHTWLRVHLSKGGEEKQANQVFEKGVAALKKDSLPLWKLMIQYEHTKVTNKVEDLFKKGCNDDCPEISGPLKPMYLEWLVLARGIVAARRTYDMMFERNPTSCLEMHRKMIYLESIQPSLKKQKIRNCHLRACANFGDKDVDVWIDFYKFEVNNGEPKKAKDTCIAAHKNLPPSLFELFQNELTVFKSQMNIK